MKELKNLLIDETPKTPLIDFNRLSGELVLSGKSIPENAAKVYEPVFNWLSDYILQARPTTNLRLNLEYYNTASSLWIAKIIKVLIHIKDPDYVLIIHIYLSLEDYEDIEEFEDIKDAFAPLTSIFFDAIPNVGIKIYGTDDDGKIVKEKLVFL